MTERLRIDQPLETWQGIAVYYLDNHVLIVDKPANLPTQADASGDPDVQTLMKAFVKQRFAKPGAVYLGLVHRLDRPVSGLLALARTGKGAARLSEQVRKKELRRLYLAWVQGEAPERGELEDVLRKDPHTHSSAVVPPGTPEGKSARLAYRRLGRAGGDSLLMVRLETGRSHQIRVQLAHAGLPIWGDARYGGGQPGQPIALRAAALGLAHPTRDLYIEMFAPGRFAGLPAGMQPGALPQVREALEDWL